jgi:hypothetical protein
MFGCRQFAGNKKNHRIIALIALGSDGWPLSG